ncbi:MAG TPA: septum formation family protein [Jatrophihabitans sp.]|uniref:septum formation family protein n=1 Tax=Jatrophihabitans sp. TaxID=1932789 RepID=UPI002EE2A91A
MPKPAPAAAGRARTSCHFGPLLARSSLRCSLSKGANAAALITVTLLLSGCGWFGGSKAEKAAVSVFDIKPGQCFNPPSTVKSELSRLGSVPCDQPHTQESYASIPFASKDGSEVSAYPGDAALKLFADRVCAQEYSGYVGKDYLDSSYFFTYLLPSARGWEQQKDRNVLCFVTTTGQQLTASVKNSKR